jgi:hypothetical protein
LLEVFPELTDRLLLTPDGRLPLLDRVDLAVYALFFLLDPLLDPFDLVAALCQLSIKCSTKPDGFILCRDLNISPGLLGFLQELVSLTLHNSQARICATLEDKQRSCNRDRCGEECCDHGNNDPAHGYAPLSRPVNRWGGVDWYGFA